MASRTKAAPTAAGTRTRKHGRARAEYRVAGAAMREARSRFSAARAEGRVKCKASAEVLMTLLAEIGGYSKVNDTMGVRQVEQLTGIPRSTVQRALDELAEIGCISRVAPLPGRRGMIALPIVDDPAAGEPDDHDDTPPVDVPRFPQVSHVDAIGVPPIEMGHTEKKATEKKESVRESETLRRAREAGRAGARPHAPGLASLTSMTAWAPSTPKPDPARDAERQELAREIERRRRAREMTA